MPGNLSLFALHASRTFGTAVAAALGTALAQHEEREFDDGEHKARPLTSVRGHDVFVIQSLHGDETQSVNDKLCRLLFFLATLRDAGAARVTAVLPYLCYARKDRRSQSRDPLTTQYLARLLEAMSIDAVLTVDVHNPAASENAFRCLFHHLEANVLFAAHFARELAQQEVVVISPDSGGVKRAERLRVKLEAAMARSVRGGFMEKHRRGGELTGNLLAGDVNGRAVIIVDDLVSSGTTLIRTAQACRAAGAREVHAAFTHGVFSAGADGVLDDPVLDRLVFTDTVSPPRLGPAMLQGRALQLSVAALFANAVRRLHGHGSLTELR